MTLKEAKALLGCWDLKIQKRDGEYRVYPKRGTEMAEFIGTDGDYFTDDLEDAYSTAQDMHRRFDKHITPVIGPLKESKHAHHRQ